MPSSTTELIKGKLDVVDFIRGYLQIQPAGKNFKARCPFHNEKTPSFMISPDRQSWHCFGCGIGGDIFAFLMRYENLEFGEALRVLAEKTGVELKRLNPQEYKLTGLLYEINEKAKEFWKGALRNFAPAKKYLSDRRLRQETIDEFELGWASNEPEALSMRLLNLGYSPDDLLRAGLAVKTERGLLLDRFRGRIIFPIHNHLGRISGFTGRVLPQFESADFAKYVNSPETAIFNKSKLLYGFWKTKNEIRESNSVFLVEGQMDFLMSWQAGVKNVVATSGTALTVDHLRSLHRLTETIILSFDNDDAGAAAAERAIDLAEVNDFNVKIAVFGEYKDPAEAAEAGGEILREIASRAVPAQEFYFKKYLGEEKINWSSREALQKLRAVLLKIRNIASPVERGFWLKELSRRAGLEEKILFEEFEKLPASGVAANAADISRKEEHFNSGRSATRRELIGGRLLSAGAATRDYGFFGNCAAYLAKEHIDILNLLKSGENKSADPRLDELMSMIILGADRQSAGEVEELKNELKKEYFKEKRQELSLAVRRAEEAGDEAKLHRALEELNNLPAALES